MMSAIDGTRSDRSDGQPDKTSRQWLENCVATKYGISKTDFRFQQLLKEYTVCHAEHDGVRQPNVDPAWFDPREQIRPGR